MLANLCRTCRGQLILTPSCEICNDAACLHLLCTKLDQPSPSHSSICSLSPAGLQTQAFYAQPQGPAACSMQHDSQSLAGCHSLIKSRCTMQRPAGSL